MRHILRAGMETRKEESTFKPLEISLEEADVMADEARQCDEESSEELVSAERLLEVSDGLEDMAIIADQIETATPVESALMATAGQMAVAGTDVEPEEIVPAMESARTGMESAASMRQKAADILKGILAMLQKIWAGIDSFFYNMVGEVPRARKALADLKAKLKEGVASEGEFEVKTGAKLFVVDDKPIKDGAGLQDALKDLSEVVRWTMENRPRELKAMSGDICTALRGLDKMGEAKSVGDLMDFQDAFLDEVLKAVKLQQNLPNGKAVKDPRWPNFTVQRGAPLIGNVTLFARSIERTGEGDKDLGLQLIERARNSEITLDATSADGTAPTSVSFRRFDAKQIGNIVAHLEDILDAIEGFSRGEGPKIIKAAREDIEVNSKKAAEAWDKIRAEGIEGSDTGNAIIKNALSLNLSFAKWSKEPISSVQKHAMVVVRGVMAVIAQSMKAEAASAEDKKEEAAA